MVTDIRNSYTSPAGKEFTLTAGRIAGISTASHVLDIGCGYGEGVCNMVEEFRCKATAVDLNPQNIDDAGKMAVQRKISHLIHFEKNDALLLPPPTEPFNLVTAEGGVLSFIGRKKGLDKAAALIEPRGFVAFSDLITISEKIPNEIQEVFSCKEYHYETEASYRRLAKECGYSVVFMCLVPPSGWDNYYAHMARRLEDDKGFFADRKIKLAFHREIDVFYRLEALKYIGYLAGVLRKN